jgi:hypothetical protein
MSDRHPKWQRVEPGDLALYDRLRSRVYTDSNGCWVWFGATNDDGYGLMLLNGVSTRTHVVSYELHVGPVPAGLVIDHLCRNRACANPDHMEPVTRRENTLRGTGPTAVNAAKTECDKGHPYTPENTLTRKDGARRCRECNRAYQREWMRNKRAEVSA